MDKPSLAANFSNPVQANMACGMLCANGINATVITDEMATIYGAGSTWAPVKLFVPSTQLNQALKLLREHGDI